MMKFQLQCTSFLLAMVALTTSAFSASIPEREIQFRSIDFTTGIIELYNFGNVTEDLSGWRFCTHDEDETREYTASTGLNGVSIASGESLFIHTNNDSGGATGTIDISTLGGNFATPFDSGAFGMGLYYQTPFGVGANIADHIQWSIDGIDNTSADERSDEAETGGVWTDQSTWIATQAGSQRIVLTDLTGSDLQGPSNYLVDPDPEDLNLDGFVDSLDLGILLGNWGLTTTPDQGELDGIPPVDSLDLGLLLGAWNPPPAAATAVPEPTAMILFGIALLPAALRRSK